MKDAADFDVHKYSFVPGLHPSPQLVYQRRLRPDHLDQDVGGEWNLEFSLSPSSPSIFAVCQSVSPVTDSAHSTLARFNLCALSRTTSVTMVEATNGNHFPLFAILSLVLINGDTCTQFLGFQNLPQGVSRL